MNVTICGPNLNDQSKGEFHVHATGCADLVKHARLEPEYRYGWTVEAASREDVAAHVYEDHIAEHESEQDWMRKNGQPDYTDAWTQASTYLSEFHFFPCCNGLEG